MNQTANLTVSFEGLGVAAFESRNAKEIATLISRHGGVPHVALSVREVPFEENSAVFGFAQRLLNEQLDAVIFMTGVGATTLLNILESRYSREEIVRALSKVTVVARGPKAVRALRNLGVPVTISVPEPNTWHEVLSELEEHPHSFELHGSRIAIQEYGVSNERFIGELKARGTEVLSVPVYRWALPEDLAPLKEVIQKIIDGRAQVVVFTNAVQVTHVMQVAGQTGIEESLRNALPQRVVCSVGPTCTEALTAQGITVDIEPEHHKMGILIHEAARLAPSLFRKKAQGETEARPSLEIASPAAPPSVESAPRPRWHNSRFMKACRREPTDATPVWLMRQAGRYLKEYQAIRARTPFLELCKNPDRVAEVTITATEKIGADAAILFADLLLIAEPMGFRLEYEKGSGPWVTPALRTPSDVDRLREVEPQDSLAFVFEAVRRTRASLDSAKPLIGFSGAPFTLASYLIEGGASRNFRHTKALMFRDPGAWHALMERLTRGLIKYVNGQIEAGVQAVQIFDSWVGCLSPSDYREFVQPHARLLLQHLKPGVPIIHFGTGTGLLLESMRDAGGSVIGLDSHVELDEAWKRLGPEVAVQGNLDPMVLYADLPFIRQRVQKILRQAAGRLGHIFNLGHGVLPDTPVEHVIELVKMIHEESSKNLNSLHFQP
ncbi:MAG TPA: uroporphyrinogen decarboxylase [Terriglobia bacterium]|nr:uroporphyrinogen decarboxylase [Terriglobia bacterium]